MKKPDAKRHPLKHVVAFRKTLLKWFKESQRSYPWRKTRDPWAILVSEIMLQQTTVASVLANRRFETFLAEFPDVKSIAEAPEQQILRAWEGLGYYNRVRNLQKTARAVLDEFNGKFPSEAPILESLPGIGPYTAGAVSSFAFDRPAPIVDGNIARVLSRLFDSELPIDNQAGKEFSWETANKLLDRGNPRLFNSALMELGQTICTPRAPACLICPVRDFCRTQKPLELPVKKPRKKFVSVEEHAILWIKGPRVLLSPGHDSRRQGFWKLPLRPAESLAHLEALSTRRYVITHHKVTLHIYRHKPSSILPGEKFHLLSRLSEIPIATPVRKVLDSLLD